MPLRRDGRPVQKMGDIAAIRMIAEQKYGGNVGADPEPLTDYQNVCIPLATPTSHTHFV